MLMRGLVMGQKSWGQKGEKGERIRKSLVALVSRLPLLLWQHGRNQGGGKQSSKGHLSKYAWIAGANPWEHCQ